MIEIALAGVVLGLTYGAHFGSNYTNNRQEYVHLFTGNEIRSLWQEYLLMAVVPICLLISSINLYMHCRSLEFYWKPRIAIYDFFYHCAAALALGVCGILFIISGVKIQEINCLSENDCQIFELKLAAGGISMMSAVIFGATGTIVMTLRKDVEREALMAEKDIPN